LRTRAGQRAHLDFRVLADAREDALAHAADDARGVARALVHAELDVVAAEEEGAAAEDTRRGFRRDAGARGALAEEKGDVLVEERLGRHPQVPVRVRAGRARREPRLRDVLEDVCLLDEPLELGRGQVREAHEVGHAGHGHLGGRTVACGGPSVTRWTSFEARR
jgi:hypothetical protein